MATTAKKTSAPAAKKAPASSAAAAKAVPPKPASASSKSTPAPAKAAASTTKAAPPKPPEKKPEPAKAAASKPAAKEETASSAPEVTDADTLTEVALDRGWAASDQPEDSPFDVVYTKGNPVLGGYETLRIGFKGKKVGALEHENLNRPVEVPEKAGLDYAVSVLTGEPIPAS